MCFCMQVHMGSPSSWIILCPDPHILVQMMGSQDRRVTCQVLKIIHDHSHEKIEHLHTHVNQRSDELSCILHTKWT